MGNFSIPNKRTGGVKPDGVYMFTIRKAEQKRGPKSEYIALHLAFERGGGLVFHNLMLNENSRGRMEDFLDAINAPASGNTTVRSLIGKKVWAKVGNESYQGKLKNIIVNWLTSEMAEQLRSEQPTEVQVEQLDNSEEEDHPFEDVSSEDPDGEQSSSDKDEFPF